MTADQSLGARWFRQRGWQPFPFQQAVWEAIAAGRSGLLHATTGSGKTYAVWLGALSAWAETASAETAAPDPPTGSETAAVRKRRRRKPPLTVLWITPMKALAADTLSALEQPMPALGLDWTVALRTGDTPAYQKSKQLKAPPTALVTTPESLALLLTQPAAAEKFGRLKLIVVDEWHELLGNKRGVLLQLALARLRTLVPAALTWGMSATIANLEHAARVLAPQTEALAIVRATTPKQTVIDTLFPQDAEQLPYYSHLGLTLLPYVAAEIERYPCNLLFTNTRAQCELWYQALLDHRPDWAGCIALHHSALDGKVRKWVEKALKDGRLLAVVCTSSLDLGVDFLPVERVFQIGSPKGIARMLQRAGRSGHAPGKISRLTLVPTCCLEYLESAALQHALALQRIEPRHCPDKPLDVLTQHLVSVGLASGFNADALFAEVTRTFAYRSLTREEWQWCLDFLAHGGASLGAYPDYHRLQPNSDGLWQVANTQFARRHRTNIGTIVGESLVTVKYWTKGRQGGNVGSVEENFVSRLSAGDHFILAGKLLEFVKLHNMVAYVKRGKGKKAVMPRWSGGRLPLTTELAEALIEKIAEVEAGRLDGAEMRFIAPLLALQQRRSALPSARTLLIELWRSREGWHAFVYPFAGRGVHLGLAGLVAWRLAKKAPRTFSISVNDYGFELLSFKAIDWLSELNGSLFDLAALEEDIAGSLNAGEMARRRFREIAQISGLIFNSHPGALKSAKQLQASAGLFFDVFKKYDPANLLLAQADREVLSEELDIDRLRSALRRIQTLHFNFQMIKQPTPFSFPLIVDRLKETLSSEKLSDRIAQMLQTREAEQNASNGESPNGNATKTLA